MRRVGHYKRQKQLHQYVNQPNVLDILPNQYETLASEESLVERIVYLLGEVKEVLFNVSDELSHRIAEHCALLCQVVVTFLGAFGFIQYGQFLFQSMTKNTLVMHQSGLITGPSNRDDVNIWRQDFKFVTPVPSGRRGSRRKRTAPPTMY